MDLALGEVGMKKDDMLRMSWGDLWRTIYGYWIRDDRQWDRTRHILAMIYNVNRNSKKQRARKPHEMIPLAIDGVDRKKRKWSKKNTEQYNKALKAWDFDILKKQRHGKRNSKNKGDNNRR